MVVVKPLRSRKRPYRAARMRTCDVFDSGQELGSLQPPRTRARLSFSGRRRTVTDGPFAEVKELIAGFAIVQVVELSDFPSANVPPEAAAHERRMRSSLAETDPTNEGGSK